MTLRTLRPLAVTAALALAGCSPSSGQGAAAAPEEAAGAALGRIELPATGAAEARPWFERGVAALHSFWYDEAAEAFRRAREIDPGFVLAYWGEAMTHNHPIWDQVELEEGRAALAALAPTAAERAAAAPTERERAYLAAVELLFAGEGEKDARDEAYAEAMTRLAERWPEDFEARTFHALALEGVAYGGVPDERRFPLLMRAAAELEELFDQRPDHPGVLHYLIHAYDDPVHAPLGLRAARLYAEVAPAAHHALHMPSHIFVQLGRWDQAAASNEDAWEASVAWVEEDGMPLGHRDYHSLSWLLYAYLQQGRLEAARELLDRVGRDAEASPGRRIEHARDEMTARYRVEALGMGAEEGEAGLGEVLAARAAAGGEAAEVLERSAAALSHLAAERPEEALAALDEAVAAEEALGPPSGPPDTFKPAHELRGEVLLALGRPAEAAESFEASLRRTPRRALSLLGAARAAAALGEGERAAERYRELLAVWQRADADLPALAEARERAEAAPSPAGR
ncbi:MAG TPA: tetratricopeptide repeat protein [Thermoanaerobaculia bacterium]